MLENISFLNAFKPQLKSLSFRPKILDITKLKIFDGIIFDKEEELFQAQSLSNHDEDLFFMAHHTLIDSRNFDLPKEKTVLWTVNDELDFQRYMEMEIYGVVTDIPDTMQLYRK